MQAAYLLCVCVACVQGLPTRSSGDDTSLYEDAGKVMSAEHAYGCAAKKETFCWKATQKDNKRCVNKDVSVGL